MHTSSGSSPRRLYADRVGLLIAQRDTDDVQVAFDGLPMVTVEALSDERADELLRLNVDGALADDVRRHIIDDAGGGPLALLELTRELSPDQRAGIEPLPTPYPISRDLQARFLRRIRTLPVETQTFLLVAAADPTGDPDLVRNAARHLGCGAGVSAPAEVEGLLQVGPRIDFRHSLVRSAVYQGAAEQERRRAHEALATVIDPQRAPERRAWHRAAATVEPDEEVAAELEHAASHAKTSGGYAASATLLGRAAQLTPDPGRRAARYLDATVAALTAGKARLARSYLALALPHLVDPLLMAQARRLEATVDFINVESGGSAAVTQARRREVASVMLDAASSLQLLDMRLARDTVLEAFPMAIYAGAFSSASPSDVARAAQTMRLADTVEPSAVDALLDALADLFADGYAAAVPGLRSAVAALYGDAHARRYPRLLTFGLYAAFALGDDDSARRLARECVARGRAVDGWQVVAESLGYLGHCELRVGTLESANRYYTEVSDLGALLGHVAGADHAYKLVVAAWRGEANEVRAGAEVMSREGRERSVGYIVDKCDHAVALLELGLGNYHAASLRTSKTFDLDLAFAPMRAADAVEAHVRGGDRRVAEGLVEWLTERATATQSPVDLGLLARAARADQRRCPSGTPLRRWTHAAGKGRSRAGARTHAVGLRGMAPTPEPAARRSRATDCSP